MVGLLALGAVCMAALIGLLGFLIGRRGMTSHAPDEEQPVVLPRAVQAVQSAVAPSDDLERSGIRPSKRPAASAEPAPVLDRPTAEFPVTQDPHEEITAQGAQQVASLVRATLGCEDEERTSFYQPDMQVLDSLRVLAAEAENSARESRTSGVAPRPDDAVSAPRQVARK